MMIEIPIDEADKSFNAFVRFIAQGEQAEWMCVMTRDLAVFNGAVSFHDTVTYALVVSEAQGNPMMMARAFIEMISIKAWQNQATIESVGGDFSN